MFLHRFLNKIWIFGTVCDAVYVHLTKTPPRLRRSLIAISSSLLAWWEIDTEYKMKIKNKERKILVAQQIAQWSQTLQVN